MYNYEIHSCHVGTIRTYPLIKGFSLSIHNPLPHNSDFIPERIWVGSINKNDIRSIPVMEKAKENIDLKKILNFSEVEGGLFLEFQECHLNKLLDWICKEIQEIKVED